MRAVVQRVTRAAVTIDDEVVGSIGPGMLTLLGVAQADSKADAAWLAGKLTRLRIYADDHGRFNRSLLDTSGEMLVVSQFTIFADARKGTRPSFSEAAAPELAEPLYEHFCALVEERGVTVARGRFGAMMRVNLVNDGPVTLVVDSPS